MRLSASGFQFSVFRFPFSVHALLLVFGDVGVDGDVGDAGVL